MFFMTSFYYFELIYSNRFVQKFILHFLLIFLTKFIYFFKNKLITYDSVLFPWIERAFKTLEKYEIKNKKW